MATSKLLEHYDPMFFRVFEAAIDIMEGVELPLKDRKEAVRLRGQFYAFREALYEEPHKAPKLAIFAPLYRFRIQDYDKKTTLTVYTEPS